MALLNHYGALPRACQPYRERTKGKVERPFRYIRQDFFLARTFRNMDDLNAQFDAWRTEVANPREIIEVVSLEPRIGGPLQQPLLRVKAKGIECIVSEPALPDEHFFNSRVMRDPDAFKSEADLIIANRRSPDLSNVTERVFSRDVFGID